MFKKEHYYYIINTEGDYLERYTTNKNEHLKENEIMLNQRQYTKRIKKNFLLM